MRIMQIISLSTRIILTLTLTMRVSKRVANANPDPYHKSNANPNPYKKYIANPYPNQGEIKTLNLTTRVIKTLPSP